MKHFCNQQAGLQKNFRYKVSFHIDVHSRTIAIDLIWCYSITN